MIVEVVDGAWLSYHERSAAKGLLPSPALTFTRMEEARALSPWVLLIIVGAYFVMLLVLGYLTSGKGDNATFFKAGSNSPWYLVAWGMIGTSLSGVTFVSVPGAVGVGGLNQQLSYMQVVMGYLLGYAVIALVLLPLYYRLGLTSIYTYLQGRFGQRSYHTGAAFFQLSRMLGSALRLYLVAVVLDGFVLGPLGFPLWATVVITLVLIYSYTYRGGIQTIVYTDTIQTLAMMVAVVIAGMAILNNLGSGVGDLLGIVSRSGLDQVFFFEGGWSDDNNFWKQFFSGALITIVMTGLDQDMMQKNLTCRTLPDAQKNMATFAMLLVPINLMFLTLGILLYQFIAESGIQPPLNAAGAIRGDQVFPMIAFEHMGVVGGVAFIIGLVAAAYSSADGSLTALTTSFCVDFLGFEQQPDTPEVRARQLTQRRWVHIGWSVAMFVVIISFWLFAADQSIINKVFKWAGFTYGPLLGLFTFGMLTRRQVRDVWVPVVCVLAPVITYVLDANSVAWFNGLKFGFTVLAINGLLTYLGLLAISYNSDVQLSEAR